LQQIGMLSAEGASRLSGTLRCVQIIELNLESSLELNLGRESSIRPH